MADSVDILKHVQDADVFELPFGLELHIPQPLAPLGIHITKFMVLEVIVAVVMLAVFIPLARRVAGGKPARGRLWNLFEVIVVFVRDDIARPAIGRHDAVRFLPFLWTTFFFILFLNLMGLVPWAGSATGALGTTGALAVIVFVTVVGAGIVKYGVVKFWIGQVPHMQLPLVLAIPLKPMIFVIEVFGLLVKHFVLAVRLFANMFGGHMVLAAILGFIVQAAGSWLWYVVTPTTILGATAMCLLELLIAFIQAYVFTFLAALFIGMAVHQH